MREICFPKLAALKLSTQYGINEATRPKGIKLHAVELELEKILGLPVELVQEKLLRGNIRQAISAERELVYEKIA